MCAVRISSVLRLGIFVSCFFCRCFAADPAKDPAGWGDLRFGMTPKEVVEAMGAGVHVENPRPQRRPFRSGDTVDIPSALVFAKETISGANKVEGGNEEIMEAAKRLHGQLKPRGWSFSQADNPHAPPEERRKPPIKVTATLESFSEFGAFQAYDRSVVLRPANKAAQILKWSDKYIDQKSKDYIQKVEAAVEELADLAAAREGQSLPNRNQIDPSLIRTKAVTVRGITLQLDFTFDGESLTKIRLHHDFEGDDAGNLNYHGMHRTLCEALAEKYGKADEDNDAVMATETIWRFPKTVLRCKRYQWNAPGSAYVRKGVSISYEMPSQENVNGDDNL
jgi:hypothetical protein